MARQFALIMGGVFASFTFAGCEPVRGAWQDVEPAKLTLHFAVATHEPHLDDLDAVIESFEADGPDVAPESVRWLPLHKPKHWLPGDNQSELDLNVGDLPEYIQASRRLIVRPHDDRMYLLVHAVPPKLPDGVEPTKSLTVAEARRGIDVNGRPAVDITLDEEGGQWVAMVSLPHVGLPLVVVVDGEVYSAPILRSQIGRRLQITGEMSDEQVRVLRNRLLGIEWIPLDENSDKPE
jgi:hypothetical protein